MFRLDIEWDCGQGNLVFSSIAAMTQWLSEDENMKGICKDEHCTIADLKDNGLISWEQLEVVNYEKDVK